MYNFLKLSMNLTKILIIRMSLFRNLGPISFYDQTEAYEIFQTLQGCYILQMKPEIKIRKQELQSQLQVQLEKMTEKNCPSLKASLYQEKTKPIAIFLEGCFPFDFSQVQITQVCRIIHSIEKTVLNWQEDRIGEIHRSLFFVCREKTFFLSLPILQRNKSTLKDEIIRFLQGICKQKQSSHILLLKKLRQCNDLQSLFDEARYFANVVNLKIEHSHMLSSNSKQFKTSMHSQSEKRCRRKIPIFKKTPKGLSLFQEAKLGNSLRVSRTTELNSTNEPYEQHWRNSSKALHLSGLIPGQHYKSQKKDSFHKNKIHSTNQRLKISSKNLKSFQKKGFINSSSLAISTICNQRSAKKINRNLKTNSSSNVFELSQQSRKSIKNQSNKSIWMKQMVNKSLQKWKNINNSKIMTIEKENMAQISVQSKKRLKRTGHVPPQSSQITQIVQTTIPMSIQDNQKPRKQNKLNLQETMHVKPQSGPRDDQSQFEQIKLGLPATINQSEINKQTTKSVIKLNKLEHIGRITRQMIERIPLKDAHNTDTVKNSPPQQQTQKPSSSTQRKPGPKKTRNRPQSSLKKQIKRQIDQLDRVGETVVNASSLLTNYSQLFYQLPMFFLYKQYYSQRLQVCMEGFSELQEDNKAIEKSLKGLLKLTMKKGKDIKGWKEAILPNLNLDFTETSNKSFMLNIIEDYSKTLYDLVHTAPQIRMHLTEVLDAWMILEGEPVTLQRRKLAASNQIQVKMFYKESLCKLNKKFNL